MSEPVSNDNADQEEKKEKPKQPEKKLTEAEKRELKRMRIRGWRMAKNLEKDADPFGLKKNYKYCNPPPQKIIGTNKNLDTIKEKHEVSNERLEM